MGVHSLTRNNDENEMENENENEEGILDINNIRNSVNKRLSQYDLKKKELKEKAKMPLKTPCPCGSNKKYKNCCLLRED